MIFIFICNLSITLVSDLNLLGLPSGAPEISGEPAQSYIQNKINELNSTFAAVAPESGGNILSGLNAVFQLIIIGIPFLFEIFIQTTILFPIMLIDVGVPPILVAILSPIIYLIEFMGLWQLWTGRSFREAV